MLIKKQMLKNVCIFSSKEVSRYELELEPKPVKKNPEPVKNGPAPQHCLTVTVYVSDLEPKWFNFGSGLISSPRLPLKKCTITEICLNNGINELLLIVAASDLTFSRQYLLNRSFRLHLLRNTGFYV